MIEEQAKLYLCRPNGNLLTQLNGVRTDSVEYAVHVKDYNEISFTVDRFIEVDGELVESNGYEDIKLNMNILLEGKDVFQLQEPTISNDGIKEYKTVKGYSREKEFEDKDWVGLRVNTGEEDSLEYLVDGNIDEYGFAKEYITIYRGNNSGKTDFSLVHYILQKMPGWTVDDDDIDHLLWTRKIQISEDSINLYALLTNVIGPKGECLFFFDTINKKIKAVAKEHLDDWSLDSNIFISMRNLANQIDVQVDEDSVFTVFTPQGENELNVRGANYNDAYVYDLSYFKAEPWMTPALVDKIDSWETWRDENREAFMQLSKDRAAKNAEIYDVDYKVPNDADVWTQWDNMDTELLQKNLQVFQKQLEFLQVSVDPDPQYDHDGNYIPHKTSGGQVDHDYYLDLLRENNAGYYTYLEIYQYVIPNIQIAIRNKGVVEDQKEEYVKSYETNWALYGIIELEAKEEGYKQQMETLKQYARAWSQLSAADKAKYVNEDTYNIYHNEYVKFKNYLGTATTAGSLRKRLADLRNKKKTLENQLATIDNNILTYVNTANIENSQWGLTEDELVTFRTLCHHTDYTNSNILTTSIDTTISTVDVEYELYQDAVSKLSEVSRPQFSFQVDLDNLLNIPEFESWVDDFELLRFMRLGIRDDFSVKLRLTGYTTNPCEIDPNLSLEFSSFITSKSGRSDLTDLLNSENNRGSKNSITIGTGTSKDDKEYLMNLLTMLTRSGMFTSAVQGVASNVFTVGSVSANALNVATAVIDDAHVNNLIAEYVDAGKINVDKITGREAWFQTMQATYIDSEFIITDVLRADSGSFSTLMSDVITANSGVYTTLMANMFSNATGHIFNLTADNAVVDQAFINEQISKKITVGDLAAHSATADRIVLISSDGSPAIAFQNATQQFYDSNGNVRVQIGQDGNGDFNFIVRGANGQTALFNENGITQSGIPNNTIVNNMINNGTIEKTKLAFDIIEPNQYGGVDITNIYDGSGNQFGAQYTSFVQATQNSLSDLQRSIADISDDAVAIQLTGDQIFVQDYNGTMSPANITIRATTYNNVQVYKWYIDGVENTAYPSSDKKTFTMPSSVLANKTSVIVKAENADGSVYDQLTIYKIIDAAPGKGISSINVEYAISTSENVNNMTRADGTTSTWSTFRPNDLASSGEYIWLRYHYYYDDGTDGTSNSIYDSTTTGISSILDMQNGTIRDSVWQKSYVTVTDSSGQPVTKQIKEAIVDNTTNINGITSRVSSAESTLDAQNGTITNIQQHVSTIEQTANMINLVVQSGSSQSSLTLTDAMMRAITDQLVITDSSGSSTIISGGKMTIGAGDIADMVINGGLIMRESDITGLYTTLGEPLYTTQGEWIGANGQSIIVFDNADNDNTGGWVSFNNQHINIPYFEINLTDDYFDNVSGYVLDRNGIQYVTWYDRSENKWYAKLTDGTGTKIPWEWGTNDIVIAEYNKHSQTDISIWPYAPARSYMDVVQKEMLRNMGVTGDIVEVTTIDGGHIETGTITAAALSTDAIMSRNYTYSSGLYSDEGTFFDLANGMIRSENFLISEDGNVYLKGDVIADSGRIGGDDGFLIESGRITTGNISKVNNTSVAGVYVGNDGFNVSGGTAATTAYFSASGMNIGGKLTYDGTTLSVNGNITSTSGSIGGFTITSSSIYRGNSSYGNASGIYFGTSGLSLTDKFKVSSAGALTATSATISGSVTATTGAIGGFTITSSSIYRGNSAYGNASGIYFGSNGLSLTDKFKVSSAGALTATSATISGSITSTSGTIGGFTIGSSYLRNGSISSATNTSVSGVYLGKDGINISGGTAATTSYITKTDINIGGKLTYNGSTLSINGSVTTGSLTATGGTIGGWTISSTNLQSTLSSGNNRYQVLIQNAGSSYDSGRSVFLVRHSSDSGTNWTNYFRVTWGGKLIASNVELSGKITTSDIKATGGTIGGFTIGSSSIYNGTNSTSSTTAGIYIGTNGIRNVGSSHTTTITSGSITTNSITATGGTIGGFTIGSASIYKGTNSITSNTAGVYVGTNGIRNVYVNGSTTYKTTIYQGALNTNRIYVDNDSYDSTSWMKQNVISPGYLTIRSISSSNQAAGQFTVSVDSSGETSYASVTMYGSMSILKDSVNSHGNLKVGGNIHADGTITNGSDERRKNIYNWDTRYDDLILSIKPINFTWKDSNDKYLHVGVGAQTVEKLLDEHGIKKSGLVIKQGDFYSVSYIELAPMMLPTLQKTFKRSASNEERIKQLEKRIKELEKLLNT